MSNSLFNLTANWISFSATRAYLTKLNLKKNKLKKFKEIATLCRWNVVTNFNCCTRKKSAVIWSVLQTYISKKDKEAALNSG